MDRDALDFHRSAAHSNAAVDQMPISDHRSPQRRLELRPREVAARAVQTVALNSILKGAREAIIDFDGAAYRLRITRNHRLILTK
jgi:hemin uptake protein HemP